MNLNHYFSALLIVCASTYGAPTAMPERSQRMEDLKIFAAYINQYEPIDDLFVVTPAYTILNHNIVERFLAGIPEQNSVVQKRRRKPNSLLAFIKREWQTIATNYQREHTMSDATLARIQAIQKGIKAAFKHDIILALLPENKDLHIFISDARSRKSPMMIRSIADTGMEKVAAVFPVDAEHIQLGIAQALINRFSPERIELYLKTAGKNPALPSCALLLQHFIGNEVDTTIPLVSGVVSSFEPTKMIPGVTTISATYGLPLGIKDGSPHDTYHVQEGMIFPHIQLKTVRYSPDTATASGVGLVANSAQTARSATLNSADVYALEKLAQRIQQEYIKPISIWFIKHDHTVYLLDLELHPEPTMEPQYLDPRYVRKCDETQKVTIELVTPFFDLIELKSREQVILAPNVQALLELYNERENKDKVRVGIIRDYTSNWQSDIKRLRNLGIRVIRVAAIERVRDWMHDRLWPLVVDPQQKVIVQYKRRKHSCALFYTAQTGTYLQEEPTPLSILPTFIPRVSQEQRKELIPDEFFGGVSLERLFDLLLKEEQQTAIQALRTILFRLKYAIKRAKIPDCTIDYDASQVSSFHTTFIDDLKQMYSYVEAVAWHVLKELKKWHASKKQPSDEAQLHFAINMLKGITLQQENEQNLLYAQSFKHLLATDPASLKSYAETSPARISKRN